MAPCRTSSKTSTLVVNPIRGRYRNDPDMFNISSLAPIIIEIEKLTGKKYADEENKASMRIIADHLTAATFLIKDGVFPSNKSQGYVLRRLPPPSCCKTIFLMGNREAIISLAGITSLLFTPTRPSILKETIPATFKAVSLPKLVSLKSR